jgi:hypothetical protein
VHRYLLLLLAMALLGAAQDSSNPNLIVGQNPQHAGILPCKTGTNFENEQYRIVHITVDDPFRFLYAIGRKSATLQEQLTDKLANQPFTYKLVNADALGLVNRERFAPDDTRGFAVRIELVYVQNCDPAARTLDLIYRIYSVAPPKFLGGAAESQEIARNSPQITAGLTEAGSPFHFVPTGGYNRSDGLFGGGSLEVTPHSRALPLFGTFTATGQSSYAEHTLAVAMSGSINRLGRIQYASWRLNYQNDSAPAGTAHLNLADLSGQADVATRPFWKGNIMLRLGGLLQGGNMQSVAPTALLPLHTVPNAGYGSLKAFAGLSSRLRFNVLSASYGLELGAIGPSSRIDWRKHIGDIADDFWIPIGDHKPFEVESRFTAGLIQVPHAIPLAARFFGGNGDGYFMPGESWQIRDVPVIRAIPANRFYLTSQGIGADRFAGINLTMYYPVKSHPIVPKEVSTDPEFNRLLRAQLRTATSVEQNFYTWKDPHFALALKRLPGLKNQLDTLNDAVTQAQAANPNRLQSEFSDCTASIATALFDVKNTLSVSSLSQYGNLAALVPPSDDLGSVQSSCVGEVNVQLKDPAIQAAAAAVDTARTAVLADFTAIDQQRAAVKASNDMAFVRRTLDTFFHHLNIVSAGPVAVFDTAWIGPAKGTFGGNRIGPGGGVRVQFASTANITAGYAWNIDRKPGEGVGALFVSIGVRDIFH